MLNISWLYSKLSPPLLPQANNILHILVRGSGPVDIKTSPLIVVGFDLPAMTTEDFFGANMVSNLAAFLGIPASKIKVAKAVSEVRNRRKRNAVFRVSCSIIFFLILILLGEQLQFCVHVFTELFTILGLGYHVSHFCNAL